MSLRKLGNLILLVCLLSTVSMTNALAEVSEVRLARQYGIAYLPLMIVEHDKLIEKHAKQAGINVEAKFNQIGTTSMMNDALLAGSLDFGSVSAVGIAYLWDKTHGTPNEVRTLASISSIPLILNCRNPNVKTLRDITGNERIALLAPKVSVYAMVLEMAAAKTFGEANYDQLDKYVVGLSHPEGTQALLANAPEVTCHFTAPPFSNMELARPGIHTIFKASDVLGDGVSSVMLMSTMKFRSANPKVFTSVFAAMEEADDIIKRNKTYAAQVYLDMSKSKETMAEVLAILNDPEVYFTVTPKGTGAFTNFMFKHGLIKTKPSSWKDLTFPEAQQLPGD